MTKGQLEELARTHCVAHEALMGEGYELGAKSGFWRTANGTITGRIVYRQRAVDGAGSCSVAFTIRGIRLQYA